jgi:hypothetical protein
MRALLIAGLNLLLLSGCAGQIENAAQPDSSTSGSVASALGGAYNGSSSSGTLAQNGEPGWLQKLSFFSTAEASTACTLFSGASCKSTPYVVSYNNCSFKGSTNLWAGGAQFTCPSAGSITRTIQNGTTETTTSGLVVEVKTSNLYSYTGMAPSGGGTTVSASSIEIGGIEFLGNKSGGHTVLDHTLYTPTALTLNNGAVTGTIVGYNNIAHVTATSTVNVTFSANCCFPTGGTIKTTFSGGSDANARFIGATETLSFSGCGSATYSGPEAYAGSVSLPYCM